MKSTDIQFASQDEQGRPLVTIEGSALAVVIDGSGKEDAWLEVLNTKERGAVPWVQLEPFRSPEPPHLVIVNSSEQGVVSVRVVNADGTENTFTNNPIGGAVPSVPFEMVSRKNSPPPIQTLQDYWDFIKIQWCYRGSIEVDQAWVLTYNHTIQGKTEYEGTCLNDLLEHLRDQVSLGNVDKAQLDKPDTSAAWNAFNDAFVQGQNLKKAPKLGPPGTIYTLASGKQFIVSDVITDDDKNPFLISKKDSEEDGVILFPTEIEFEEILKTRSTPPKKRPKKVS